MINGITKNIDINKLLEDYVHARKQREYWRVKYNNTSILWDTKELAEFECWNEKCKVLKEIIEQCQ